MNKCSEMQVQKLSMKKLSVQFCGIRSDKAEFG